MKQASNRSFRINYETNKFELDGHEFQYVSGSFHYFRALPDVWEDRLKVMRAAGLNAIDTYIEWSLHNPEDSTYQFDGIANVEHFLELAQKQGFVVILRPGPYICAERDNVSLSFEIFFKSIKSGTMVVRQVGHFILKKIATCFFFKRFNRVVFHTGCSQSIPIFGYVQAIKTT